MIKKYTILTSQASGLRLTEEVVCDVTGDNDQGVQINDAGVLVFTCDNHDCVVYAAGAWTKVSSI